MGLGADFAVGGSLGAVGAAEGAVAGPVGAAIGGAIGFAFGFFATELIQETHQGTDYDIKPRNPTIDKKPTTPKPVPPSAPSEPPGRMDDYAGMARPIRGMVGIDAGLGKNPIPLHIDKAQARINTRALLRQMANKRALHEIDTAFGRSRKRYARPDGPPPHRRRRIDPEVLRNVRRRLDLQGITNFAGEAQRVWDEVQYFLPRH